MLQTPRKIIIFDDDQDILFICNYVFQEYGWEVVTYNNCENIEDKVAATMPDVILMDNWIPTTGGMIATQKLKANPSLGHIPVVYFSANNEIESLAAQAGADAFLAKPFELTDLTDIVIRAADNATKEAP